MVKSVLVAYIFNAMTTWSPPTQQVLAETESEASARYQSIASDLADVGLDPAEADSPVSGTYDPALKNAVLLAAVASMESNYAKFVDDGSCNQATFKADRRGSCDGRAAWTMWQLHTLGGLVIRGDEFVVRAYATPAELLDVWTGPRLISDRKGAARMALHEMRYSVRKTGSLCLYTGETSEGKCRSNAAGGIQKAKDRMNRAVQYLLSHPVQSQEI
jgi:hypothetical protein